MEVIELLPGRLHLLRFSFGQAYLWQDLGSVTLIDTGPAGSSWRIAETIRGLGYQPGDLRHLVLTHCHRDHTGAAADVGGWGDVTVLAHGLDAPVIRGEVPGRRADLTDEERRLWTLIRSTVGRVPAAPAARVDGEVGHGDVLDFGGGASVIGVPGHTEGSIAIYLPAHRVLFTGDTVARAPDGRVILGPFNVDRKQSIASFGNLAEIDADMACFGHGDPVLGGASAALRAAADSLRS
jgi:glyoxylase-like metal-dependent hydrolase (beta-lactamase superfamily II)